MDFARQQTGPDPAHDRDRLRHSAPRAGHLCAGDRARRARRCEVIKKPLTATIIEEIKLPPPPPPPPPKKIEIPKAPPPPQQPYVPPPDIPAAGDSVGAGHRGRHADAPADAAGHCTAAAPGATAACAEATLVRNPTPSRRLSLPTCRREARRKNIEGTVHRANDDQREGQRNRGQDHRGLKQGIRSRRRERAVAMEVPTERRRVHRGYRGRVQVGVSARAASATRGADTGRRLGGRFFGAPPRGGAEPVAATPL